jgi:hypothetical protein
MPLLKSILCGPNHPLTSAAALPTLNALIRHNAFTFLLGMNRWRRTQNKHSPNRNQPHIVFVKLLSLITLFYRVNFPSSIAIARSGQHLWLDDMLCNRQIGESKMQPADSREELAVSILPLNEGTLRGLENATCWQPKNTWKFGSFSDWKGSCSRGCEIFARSVQRKTPRWVWIDLPIYTLGEDSKSAGWYFGDWYERRNMEVYRWNKTKDYLHIKGGRTVLWK